MEGVKEGTLFLAQPWQSQNLNLADLLLTRGKPVWFQVAFGLIYNEETYRGEGWELTLMEGRGGYKEPWGAAA